METSTTITSSHDNETTPLMGTVANGNSRKRWSMLVVFAINGFTSGHILGGLIPAKKLVSPHYRVNENSIEWTSYVFLLISPCLLLPWCPITKKLRIRKTFLLVSMLHVGTKIFHMNAYQENRFLVFLIGQLPAVLAYSIMLPALTKCTAQWFSLREITSVVAFSYFCCFFGFAVTFPLEKYLIKDIDIEYELKTIFLGQLVLTCFVFLLTILLIRDVDYEITVHQYNNTLWVSLKELFRNRDFVLMSQSYGIYCGIGITLIFLVNPLLGIKFSKLQNKPSVDWIGFALTLVSYLSTLIIGVWIDRFRSYRSSAIMLNIASLATWLLFTLLFFETETLFLLYAVFIGLGLVSLPYIYLGTEHAVELSHPVDELVSSAFILSLGNLYTFVFLLPISILTEKGYYKTLCLIILGLYVLSSGLVIGSRSMTRRTLSEVPHLRHDVTSQESGSSYQTNTSL